MSAGNGWVSEHRLKELLARQAEAFDLDYKRILDIQNDTAHRVKFVKLVAAMTALGGDIVIGVDNTGTPTGLVLPQLARVYDPSNLSSILRRYLSPEVTVHAQAHDVDGRLVVLVHVEPGPRGPLPLIADGTYQDKQGKPAYAFRAGERYIRDGTSNARWEGDVHQVGLLLEHRSAAGHSPLSTATLSEAVDSYLLAMRAQGKLKSRSADDYRLVLKRFVREHPEGERLNEFQGPAGTRRLQAFIDEGWGHRTIGTRGKVTAVIKGLFAWAYEADLLPNDPAAKLRQPKRQRQKERRAVSRSLAERIIREQPNLRDRVGVQLIGRLGLRKDELRQLDYGDIDLHSNEVRVGDRRGNTVYLPIEHRGLLEDVRRLVEAEKPAATDHILSPTRGADRTKPYERSSMHRWWKQCLKRVSGAPDLTMQEFRYAAAEETPPPGSGI